MTYEKYAYIRDKLNRRLCTSVDEIEVLTCIVELDSRVRRIEENLPLLLATNEQLIKVLERIADKKEGK